jgi:hypothetical protein
LPARRPPPALSGRTSRLVVRLTDRRVALRAAKAWGSGANAMTGDGDRLVPRHRGQN